MDLNINLHSLRAHKARLSVHTTTLLINLFRVLSVALIVGGFGLVLIDMAIGWFVASLAALPVMFVEWYHGELKHLPADKNQSDIGSVLEVSVLGRIKKNISAHDLVSIICHTNGGLFFGARFGLTPNTLQSMSEGVDIDINRIWQQASDVKESCRLEQITPGVLLVSIVMELPQSKIILPHLHIEISDLLDGIIWQKHIKDLQEHHQKPQRTGGIARDLSFGYTPLLSRFGRVVTSGGFNVDVEAHLRAIDQMVETFSSKGRQNIALIGPNGVGKSTAVEAFAEKLLDANQKLASNIKFRQVVQLDAASLHSAASGRGELEGLIEGILSEAYAAKNIILCLDNAELFFEEGVGSVDLSNILVPILEAGRLRIILTMEEQRFLQISQRNSALANALNRIILEPATEQETMAIMQDQLIMFEYQRNVLFTYQSLAETFRLSERYIHDLAQPGKALKLLESSAGYSQDNLVTINSVQQAIEQTMNVKVGVATNEDDKQKLLVLEDLIHERMINQTHAVQVVSDALRRARAGVRNQNRPIGTFLFFGPTGVGKTELAKALGEVYFGGEDRLIRLDMNEFVEISDVKRLIADGAKNPNSLTAMVMKQPFSVILLDEIEKAHPNVLTALLQVLDEGILRDENNRDISFRDAIFIATSNAGSDRVREYIQRGYKLTEFEQKLIDEIIDGGIFKPEFVNRFDETVVFTPLSKEDLIKVVDLIIQGVNKTLEQQQVKVEVSPEAKLLLVQRGYDPRLGARPMRRVVQRIVENNVAKLLLSGAIQPGATVYITPEQVEEKMPSRTVV